MKDLEVIKIDGGEYVILHQVSYQDKTFLYLSNILNEEDVLIRKIDKDDANKVVPIENDQEFEVACNCLLKNLVH